MSKLCMPEHVYLADVHVHQLSLHTLHYQRNGNCFLKGNSKNMLRCNQKNDYLPHNRLYNFWL